MGLVNVARVINSPRFKQNFTVYRKDGNWVNGEISTVETALTFSGAVTKLTSKDLQQIPEGDRTQEYLNFYSTEEMKVSSLDDLSDEIEYKGNRYKIMNVLDDKDYGYYKAIGIRKRGD